MSLCYGVPRLQGARLTVSLGSHMLAFWGARVIGQENYSVMGWQGYRVF